MSKLSDLLNPISGTQSPREVPVVASEVQEENHPEPSPVPAVDKLVNPGTHSTTTTQASDTPDYKINNQVHSPSPPILEHSHQFHQHLFNQLQQSHSREPEQTLTNISSLRVALPSIERVSQPSTQPSGSESNSDEVSGFQQSKHNTTKMQDHTCHPGATETASGTTVQTIDGRFITSAIPSNINAPDPEIETTTTVTSSETTSFLDMPTLPPGGKRRAGASVRGAVKRGTASIKKPQAKKKKVTRAVTGARTNDSTSSFPAGSSPPASPASEDGDEDSGELFCICRGPDDHTRMICCDSCDDWFHIRCVKINEEKADTIDKYICPNCHSTENCTTYKPLCRLPGCPRSARVEQKSKYCSDEHGREFMEGHTQETTTVPGGALSLEELASAALRTVSREEFASLGAAPPHASHAAAMEQNGSPKSEMSNEQPRSMPSSPRYMSEESRAQQIRWERQQLAVKKEQWRDKERFFHIVKNSVSKEAQHAGLADICGFDNRLSWSLEEFADWRATEAGQRALEERSLPHDRQLRVLVPGRAAVMLSSNVCYERRCPRHNQWERVHLPNIRSELMKVAEEDMALKKELKDLDDGARFRGLLEREGAPGGMVEVAEGSSV